MTYAFFHARNGQGAASGIGLSTARTFLEAGAKGVTLVDLHKGNLEKARAELEKQYSGRTLSIAGDVATESIAQQYVEETLSKWGHLDVGCNRSSFVGRWLKFLNLAGIHPKCWHFVSFQLVVFGCSFVLRAARCSGPTAGIADMVCGFNADARFLKMLTMAPVSDNRAIRLRHEYQRQERLSRHEILCKSHAAKQDSRTRWLYRSL